MDRFKKSEEYGYRTKYGEQTPDSPRINLLKPVTKNAYSMALHIFNRASEMLNAETFDEIYATVHEDIYWYYLDVDSYRQLEEHGNIELLKERLLVHFYSENLHLHYLDSVTRVKGRKGDKLQRFFQAVTTEPKHVWDLIEQYDLKISTVKNHRRFDPYPERGITKIKDWMIFRQPVDG